ncbi:hypothetical protein HEB94_001819 [Actinopolymorpha pittospori]|uniref:Uncharacterized protein n=1 Tax=Actinopolymorpha pittospori TaxID=648752 RepID=A0A927MQE1_9ACTN|nr:hypothetical protein [Actinopolymorpha pittospori]
MEGASIRKATPKPLTSRSRRKDPRDRPWFLPTDPEG